MLKRLALLLLLVGATLLLGSSARAMCVYNDTTSVIYVKFECGPLCKNTWNTEPGKMYCHSGEGGQLTSAIVDYFGPNTFAAVTSEIEVYAYAILRLGDDGRTQLCVSGGESQNTCESYKPVGQSGSTPASEEFTQLSALLDPTVLTRLAPAANLQP